MFDDHYCLVFELLDRRPLLEYFADIGPQAKVVVIHCV